MKGAVELRHNRGIVTNRCSAVKFCAWIGPSYGTEIWRRLLVLGESHYDTNEPPERFTCDVVQRVVSGHDHGYRTRLFTKIARLFLRASERLDTSRQACRGFWESVAFYNYVQDYLPRVRSRPTPAQWSAASVPFEEVLGIHKPDAVVVLGAELGRHVSSHIAGSRSQIRIGIINHPASVGWTYAKWMPQVRQLIAAAQRVSAVAEA